MSDASIGLPEDEAGKKIRTRTRSVSGTAVHEQAITVVDSSGNIINPAKEDGNLANLDITVSALRDALEGASDKNFTTTDARLATLEGYLDGVETSLDAIKDTDGIKKITDTVNVDGTVTVGGTPTVKQSGYGTAATRSGTFASFAFGTADAWAEIASFNLDWTVEGNPDAMRVLVAKVNFANAGGAAYDGHAIIIEDGDYPATDAEMTGDYLRGNYVTVPAGGTRKIKIICNQPHLRKETSAIKVYAKAENTNLSVSPDASDCRWDVRVRQDRFGLARSEYSPSLPGLAVWNTPTIIPRFTPEEFENSWLTINDGTGEDLPDVTQVDYDGIARIYAGWRILYLANIEYGGLVVEPKFNGAPAAGKNQYVGFDVPGWIDAMGFHMDGATFKLLTQNAAGSETTAITWDGAWTDAYIGLRMYWSPYRVDFFIGGSQYTHRRHIPQDPAGICFRNNDNAAGTLLIKSGLELENKAGAIPDDDSEIEMETVTLTASGNGTIIAANSERAIRLYGVYMYNTQAGTIEAGVRFGTAGTIHFPAMLEPRRGAAFSVGGRKYKEGAENEALIGNLDAAGTVKVTALYNYA